jgi:hypothetical protein
MAFIQLHQELFNHIKLRRAAKLLSMPKVHVVGHLASLWCWSLDNAPSGDLSSIDIDIIAEVAEFDGDASLFIDALSTAGFLEKDRDNLYIHDWEDYAEKLITRRKADADRKRADRESRRTSAGHPQGIQETSAGHPKDENKPPLASAGHPQDILPPSAPKSRVEQSSVEYPIVSVLDSESGGRPYLLSFIEKVWNPSFPNMPLLPTTYTPEIADMNNLENAIRQFATITDGVNLLFMEMLSDIGPAGELEIHKPRAALMNRVGQRWHGPKMRYLASMINNKFAEGLKPAQPAPKPAPAFSGTILINGTKFDQKLEKCQEDSYNNEIRERYARMEAEKAAKAAGAVHD